MCLPCGDRVQSEYLLLMVLVIVLCTKSVASCLLPHSHESMVLWNSI